MKTNKPLIVALLTAALLAAKPAAALDFSISTVSASGQAVVTVTTNNFTNLISIQGTIVFTPSVAAFNRVEVFGLPGMTSSSFGVTQVAAGKLTFSWTDGTVAGVTVPNNTVIFSMRFNLVGSAGQQTAVSFSNSPAALEFTDKNFNTVSAILTNGSITIAACLSDTDCTDDDDPCTVNACNDGRCFYTPVMCNDNDPCTIDACVDGICVSTVIHCDDSDPCTVNRCIRGECFYSPLICDDDNSCTADFCYDSLGCQFEPLCLLDDTNSCTLDECINGDCTHTPFNCNDDDCCTLDECDGNGGCTYREGSYWSLTGNAITPGDFLGTTNNEPLIFKMNNQLAGRIDGNNTAIGVNALLSNTTGFTNTAHGTNALRSNTEGYANTANGESALFSNTTGVHNTANGVGALYSNYIGSRNTASGVHALSANYSGSSNTANGADALSFNYSGFSNTANGNLTLYKNTTGSLNTANGSYALQSNTTGNSNSANGYQSLHLNKTGSYNTTNGAGALSSNIAGSNATAVGYNAMRYANNTATPFTNYNVAVGYEALRGSSSAPNNTGNNNTAIGYQSLFSNTSGGSNTANGFQALFSNTTGGSNTANGFQALIRNTTGNYNTANGWSALYSNTTGSYNTANGWSALYSNTTGSYNTASGMHALYYNRGVNNTANGFKALYTNNTGKDNTANGWYSLSSNTTGSSNTGLGWNANVSTGNLSNATAIGANALVTASNNFVLGHSSVTGWGFGTPPFSGATARAIKVGTGAANGNGAYLTVGGAWTNTSARSKKEDFTELNSIEVLKKINALEVTRWKYKGTKNEYHIGPMAEDFYELFKVGDDSSIADLDKTGVLFLGMQAQQKMIEEQKKEMQEMADKNDSKDAVMAQQQEQIEKQNQKINNMQVQMQQFQSALSQCCTGSQSSSQTTDNRQPITNLTDSPRLDQNIPNPFSQNTTITCYVPSTAKASIIKVYNLQGHELKSFTLDGNGVQKVVINGGALSAGEFLYSLFIDGNKIDTKKMTLTKE